MRRPLLLLSLGLPGEVLFIIPVTGGRRRRQADIRPATLHAWPIRQNRFMSRSRPTQAPARRYTVDLENGNLSPAAAEATAVPTTASPVGMANVSPAAPVPLMPVSDRLRHGLRGILLDNGARGPVQLVENAGPDAGNASQGILGLGHFQQGGRARQTNQSRQKQSPIHANLLFDQCDNREIERSGEATIGMDRDWAIQPCWRAMRRSHDRT